MFRDVKIIVRGTVQGVGFRATTRHHAQQLGLVGTVRNLPDGNVEICARGEQEQIDRLLTILQEEEFSGEIKETRILNMSLATSFDSFIITP